MAFGKIIIASVITLIIGCSNTPKEIQYIDRPVYVNVPVLVQPEIEPIKKPQYKALKCLNKNSSYSDIAEAYTNTIMEMKIYIKKLEIIINKFVKEK